MKSAKLAMGGFGVGLVLRTLDEYKTARDTVVHQWGSIDHNLGEYWDFTPDHDKKKKDNDYSTNIHTPSFYGAISS